MYYFLFFHTVSPPIVTITPKSYIANLRRSVEFTCNTMGFGDFSFVWEHDGSVISTSNSSLQHNSIYIDAVLPEHQGQYRCTVTSFFSNLRSDAFATLTLNGIITVHTYMSLY